MTKIFTENDGEHAWLVPELIAQNSCKWAISDNALPTASDTSRYTFTITPNIIPDTSWVYGTWEKEYSPYKVLGKATVPEE